MGDVRNDPIFETLVTYMQYLLLCGCVYMGTHSKDTYNYNEFTYASQYNIVIKKSIMHSSKKKRALCKPMHY